MPATTLHSAGWRRRCRAILSEPLVHFLAVGLALFLYFGWTGSDIDPASRSITIDTPKVEQLAAQWTQVWQRPPTRSEIDGMIRDYIREEIYNREAIRLGLDQDDVVIRRRLRGKMEYLARAELDNVRATDAELQKWLDTHRADYAVGSRIGFDTIYLGGTAENAKPVLATLAQGADWRGLGRRISLPDSYDAADRATIVRDFGNAFAQSIADVPVGQWSGPIESGVGFHLVRVRDVAPGKAPRLAEVRQDVENDWIAATAKSREERAYQTLLDAYTIRIAKP